MQNPTSIIQIQNLVKTFKGSDVAVVNDITFSVNTNEVFGLLGPNGAGKTTIISMLCQLFEPTSGKIIIDGHTITKNQLQVKEIIGVVPQDIALYPTLTARENLHFYGAMYHLKGKILEERIESWLQKLGLSDAANRRVSTFSGGMKRRVNLIASVLHQPKVLILDEPTVGVDVQSRNVIIEQLTELNKQGTTIVYTSHHLEEAEHFCTQVAIIDYGKIITQGSPKQLIESVDNARNLEDVFLHLTHRKLRD